MAVLSKSSRTSLLVAAPALLAAPGYGAAHIKDGDPLTPEGLFYKYIVDCRSGFESPPTRRRRYIVEPPPVPKTRGTVSSSSASSSHELSQGGRDRMQQNMDEVHVAYSSDPPNFAGLLSSMISLARHLKEPGRCTIHLLMTREDVPRALALQQCFQRELEHMQVLPTVEVHELQSLPLNVTAPSPHDMRPELWKPQTFARLYLIDYLPSSVPRCIWLDHDTIVRSDLGLLYRIEMKHALAAAAEWGNGTFYAYRKMVPGRYRARMPPAERPIFNSGVLVLDLVRWRSSNVLQTLEELMPLFAGVNGEQLLLNLVFQDFDRLDWRWNTMGMFLAMGLPELCMNAAKILHWTWKNKPWHSSRPAAYRAQDEIFQLYSPRYPCEAVPPGSPRPGSGGRGSRRGGAAVEVGLSAEILRLASES